MAKTYWGKDGTTKTGEEDDETKTSMPENKSPGPQAPRQAKAPSMARSRFGTDAPNPGAEGSPKRQYAPAAPAKAAVYPNLAQPDTTRLDQAYNGQPVDAQKSPPTRSFGQVAGDAMRGLGAGMAGQPAPALSTPKPTPEQQQAANQPPLQAGNPAASPPPTASFAPAPAQPPLPAPPGTTPQMPYQPPIAPAFATPQEAQAALAAMSGQPPAAPQQVAQLPMPQAGLPPVSEEDLRRMGYIR